MVRRGEFERHNFQTLLESVAEPVREALMQDLFTLRPPDLFGYNESVRWYLHTTANDLDAANWIYQCRRAGLFVYGRALYEQGGFDFSRLAEEAQIDVKEDHQVCVRQI